MSYLGFTKKAATGIYRSALSLELLHDFMLVHDDIIDKSLTRRGELSMHEMLNRHLSKYKNIKFNGEDLTIVIGDVMYALALDAFLSIQEESFRKELALKKLIQAAIFTDSGEFIELLYGTKDIDEITKEDILRIYDFKTANYTFAAPLSMGAILAGADKKQTDTLYKFGIYLGRAFQIKDDIIGLFAKERRIGKSNLTDLQEAKKTILIWYAYNQSGRSGKSTIKSILSKKYVTRNDLLKMRNILQDTATLDYASKEIAALIQKAQTLYSSCKIRQPYKKSILGFSKKMLNL
jgi:geranylgeranyl diphosphate synthase type I